MVDGLLCAAYTQPFVMPILNFSPQADLGLVNFSYKFLSTFFITQPKHNPAPSSSLCDDVGFYDQKMLQFLPQLSFNTCFRMQFFSIVVGEENLHILPYAAISMVMAF